MTDPTDPRPAPRPRASAAEAQAAEAQAALQAAAPAQAVEPALSAGDTSLLALIDSLAGLLERSDLAELEVESGGTALVLRKPTAIAVPPAAPSGQGAAGQVAPPPPATIQAAVAPSPAGADAGPAPVRPAVRAPLTGIYYGAPAPGSAPYVRVGGEVAVGQVIGLIEAMKLFNEIKSDLAGRVTRVVPDSGALVKAKQPLIEVEPL